MNVGLCMLVRVSVQACVSDPVELKFYVVVSRPVWVLDTQLRSSARLLTAAPSLQHRCRCEYVVR